MEIIKAKNALRDAKTALDNFYEYDIDKDNNKINRIEEYWFNIF